MANWLFRRVVLGAVVIGAAACACTPTPKGTTGGSVTVPSAVMITKDGAGYAFRYSGQYADAEGNIDLTKVDSSVVLRFDIAPGSVDGIKFLPDGREAMWIVEKRVVGDGSPQGPYRGEEFSDFTVSSDGRSLSVFDRNGDETVYRYALRFEVAGQTVAHDPDLGNGNGGN